MRKRKQITPRQAQLVGDCLYLDWEQVDLEQFRQGLMGYHRQAGPNLQPGSDDLGVFLAGRTVLAHMEQFPDYFVRLARLRAEVKARTGARKGVPPRSF
jgi:hypothetical protein